MCTSTFQEISLTDSSFLGYSTQKSQHRFAERCSEFPGMFLSRISDRSSRSYKNHTKTLTIILDSDINNLLDNLQSTFIVYVSVERIDHYLLHFSCEKLETTFN